MIDPGCALNVASLGYDVCKDLLVYYRRWKHYGNDVESTCSVIEQLKSIFANIHYTIDGNLAHFSDEQIKLVTDSLYSCKQGVDRLIDELRKYRLTDNPTKVRQTIRRAVYPFHAEAIRRTVETVNELTSNLNNVVTALNLDINIRGNELLGHVAQQGVDISETTQNIKATTETIFALTTATQADIANSDQRFVEAFSWLAAPSSQHIHEAALKRNEPNTGLWFLHTPQYVSWRAGNEDSSHLLWLHGKPGCGKTSLASMIVEDLQAYDEKLSERTTLYFYFSFTDIQMQTYSGFLRSLIDQIAEIDSLDKDLKREFKKHTPRQPTETALQQLLARMMSNVGPIFLVIDALDECPRRKKHGRPPQRELVIRWLEKVVLSSDSEVRAIVTSRDEESDIQVAMSSFRATSVLFTTAETNADIRRFVESQVEGDSKLRTLDPQLKEEVKSTIGRKSDGMFLLASCQIEAVKQVPSLRPKKIRAALDDLPATVEAQYHRLLTNIEEEDSDEARTALIWLAFADRTLTLQELGEACIIDPNGDPLVDESNRAPCEAILDLLGNLVVVERSSGQPPGLWHVGLAHATVKEYLTSDRAPPSFRLNSRDGNCHIGLSCLAYIWQYCQNLNNGHICVESCACMPLIQYAALQWPNHARVYNTLAPSEVLMFESRLQTMPPYGPLSSWLSMLSSAGFIMKCWRSWTLWSTSTSSGGLRNGCWFLPNVHSLCSDCLALHVVVARLQLQGSDVTEALRDQGLLLHACCKTNQKECVAMLLDAGVDLDEQNHLGTAMQVAAYHGHTNIIDVFVEKVGQHKNRRSCLGQALQAAAFRGNKDVAEQLILAGANVNEPGAGAFGRALPAAARCGHKDIVRYLLQAGADINQQSSKCGTALQAAAASGHFSIVKLLIDSGASHDAASGTSLQNRRMSALAGAFEEGERRTVEVLLASGAKMRPREVDYWHKRVEWYETYGGWRTELLRTGVCA